MIGCRKRMRERGKGMINILHCRYDIDAGWLRPALQKHIRPDMRVLVAAFAFRDSQVRCAEEWDGLYAPGGKYYGGITSSFAAYGIGEEQIDFLNYFTDTPVTAREKAECADILYFPGGLPDRMYERLVEFDLVGVMKRHEGIVMGYSAGALIQLGEYHLSPDKDYPEFGYYEGLGYLDGFYAEVHYEGTEIQHQAIRRVLVERNKPVYGLTDDSAIIVSDGRIEPVGPVQIFLPEQQGGN